MDNVKLKDRLIAAASNITGGFVGIIWMIFSAIAKKPISKFLLFYIYQSAFLALTLYILNLLLVMIHNILIMVPYVNILVAITERIFFSPIYFNWSVTGILILIVYVYMTVFALAGRIAYIPWVSRVIMYHLGRFWILFK